jgi:hypothetical protein
MGRLDRLMRPFARRASGAAMAPLDQRFETLAARLEAHTVNLAQHQAQLRDESLRAIVNEMRSNSAFLADSAVALERAEGRELTKQGAAIRPIVHEIRATLAPGATVIVVGAIDRRLIEELATYLHRVIVIDPAMEYVHPSDVVVVPRALTDWDGPGAPAPLVVWNAKIAPSAHSVDAVRSWLAPDGWLVLAAPTRCTTDGLRSVVERSFVDDGRGLRLDDHAPPALVVHTLRPE